ncbi:MAG TPA: tyrosine-type recombinase/integrase [Polyangiales bacterium]
MPDPTASRYGKGYPEWVGRGQHGCWFARVSVPGQKQRERFKLSTPEGRFLTDKEGDRELAAQYAEQVSEQVRTQAFQREQERLSARLTVKQFGELWTSNELYKIHGQVRGLKPKKSAGADKVRLTAHVYPHIGGLAVADITEQDIERCMAKAAQAAETRMKRPWRQATRFQVYQVMRRLFDLAIKPGRLRKDNPVSVDLRPSKDAAKLYGFLYPAELLSVLGCQSVPVARRVYYALAVYTGLRKGSLSALTWGSVNFQERTIVSLVSKTGTAQHFEVPETLVLLLTRWREHNGNPKGDALIVADLGCREGREAETLRADLKAAGVTRELLFSKAGNVEPLRFHDMRATFVTWAHRAGKGYGWISDRTGHMSAAMIQRYERGARMLEDTRYQPFPDISKAIPELANDVANVARLAEYRHV